MRQLWLPVAVAAAIATAGFSQSEDKDKVAAATRQAEAASPLKPAALEVPTGEGSWALRIIRTGGLAGRALDISVTSAGDVKCAAADAGCPKAISEKDLKSLGVLVDPKVLRTGKSSLGDSCRDCFVTRITVGRRDDKGKVQTYFGYFDDTTAAKTPFQLVRIVTDVTALIK